MVRLYDKKQKFLFDKLNRTLQSTILGAKLLYKKMSSKLIKPKFKQNPYNKWTLNKMVSGKQLNVVFDIDNLKVLRKKQAVLDNSLE